MKLGNYNVYVDENGDLVEYETPKVYRLYYEEKGVTHYVHCSEMCESVEEFIDYYTSISDPEDFEDNPDLYMIIEQALLQNKYDIELDSDGETDYVDIMIHI